MMFGHPGLTPEKEHFGCPRGSPSTLNTPKVQYHYLVVRHRLTCSFIGFTAPPVPRLVLHAKRTERDSYVIVDSVEYIWHISIVSTISADAPSPLICNIPPFLSECDENLSVDRPAAAAMSLTAALIIFLLNRTGWLRTLRNVWPFWLYPIIQSRDFFIKRCFVHFLPVRTK